MKKDVALDLVNSINNGEFEDLKPFFGDLVTALNFLEKKGYLHLIDPLQLDDEHKNEVIYSFLSNLSLRDDMFKKIVDRIGDVREENGQYYLIVDRLEDLADLFVDYSRDTSPQDVAKSVLSEDYWEPFNYTTDDVYRDVIEELNSENKNILKKRILDYLKDAKIEINGRASEEMELIASEQGHDDYMEVNSENIDRVFDDEDTMEYLLKYEIDDIRGDLYSIHNQAYNDAYSSELSRKVWDELSEFIDSDTQIESLKYGNRHRIKLKITKHIFNVIYQWFSDYRNYSDDFEYYGTYIGLIKQLIDEMGSYEKLSFRIPEYPDHKVVDENINEIFSAYF